MTDLQPQARLFPNAIRHESCPPSRLSVLLHLLPSTATPLVVYLIEAGIEAIRHSATRIHSGLQLWLPEVFCFSVSCPTRGPFATVVFCPSRRVSFVDSGIHLYLFPLNTSTNVKGFAIDCRTFSSHSFLSSTRRRHRAGTTGRWSYTPLPGHEYHRHSPRVALLCSPTPARANNIPNTHDAKKQEGRQRPSTIF